MFFAVLQTSSPPTPKSGPWIRRTEVLAVHDIIFIQSSLSPPRFKLTRKPTEDGSDLRLYGRGTTDCLGHVAMLTTLFIWLAKNMKTEQQIKAMNCSIVGVLIAAEEGGEFGVGVDRLMNDKKLEELRNGPVGFACPPISRWTGS